MSCRFDSHRFSVETSNNPLDILKNGWRWSLNKAGVLYLRVKWFRILQLLTGKMIMLLTFNCLCKYFEMMQNPLTSNSYRTPPWTIRHLQNKIFIPLAHNCATKIKQKNLSFLIVVTDILYTIVITKLRVYAGVFVNLNPIGVIM